MIAQCEKSVSEYKKNGGSMTDQCQTQNGQGAGRQVRFPAEPIQTEGGEPIIIGLVSIGEMAAPLSRQRKSAENREGWHILYPT